MHKKLQALLISGIMSINIIGSTGQVFANDIEIEKDIKVGKSSSEGEDTEDIVVPQESEWATFRTVEDLEGKWNYEEQEDKIILKKYLDGANNPIVEIPRIIDNKTVEMEGVNGNVFRNVTHIRVSKNGENKVKLLDTSLSLWSGFHQTSTLKYADLSGLDTTNITNLYQAFSFSPSIEYLDLSDWDVSNVTNMEAMFYKCTNLKSINLSGWNIKEGTNVELIIDLSTKLKNIVLKNMPSLNQLKRLLYGMRYGGNSSITLDVSGLKILDNETSLNGVFNNGKISKIIGLDTFDTSNITDMSSMFRGCSNLTSIDVLERWNTDNLQNMGDMFDGCRALTDMSAIKNWNTSNEWFINKLY